MGKVAEKARKFYFPVGIDEKKILSLEEINLGSGRTIICKSVQELGSKAELIPICVANEYVGERGVQEVYSGSYLTRKDLIDLFILKRKNCLENIKFTSYQKKVIRGY